jgi:hypothetical protein
MPRIYELPASNTPENKSLVIRHTPGTVPRSFKRPQQQQSGSANPRQMMAGQMDMELNNVTREFDSQVSVLDQGMLEPDKYKAEYIKLQRRAASQRIAIQAKHQAAAQQIKNMQKLVQDGMLAPEQMQATMLMMAGVPRENVKAMFAQVQRAKPSTRLNELDSIGKKLVAFQQQFEDYRGPHLFRGRGREKLYYTDPTGTRRKASKAEIDAYDDITTQIATLDREKAEIFRSLTPLEQYAQAGSQAVQRFGMGRRPVERGGFGGFGTMGVVPPTSKKQPTVAELRKLGTREAYEKGKRLGYWR